MFKFFIVKHLWINVVCPYDHPKLGDQIRINATQVEAVLRRAESVRGLSSSSSLRQPPLRPLGRCWIGPIKHSKILLDKSKKGRILSQIEIKNGPSNSFQKIPLQIIVQVPLPSLPLLPPHLSFRNLRPPPCFQWRRWGRRRRLGTRDEKKEAVRCPQHRFFNDSYCLVCCIR